MLGVDYGSVDENKAPDFKAAYDYGVRFVIVRGAYTDGGPQGDSNVARDRDAARAAGMQFGSYLILGWHDDPEAQVAKFVETYGNPEPGDIPPSLDIEFPGKIGIKSTGLTPAAALVKIETALAALKATYPTVLIYTSARVWNEDLGNIASAACGACPAWLKVAYRWAERNQPHLDSTQPIGTLPPPWRTDGSPGAFIEQFQGDAVKVPGFTSTVDLNTFLNYAGDSGDARSAWITGQLTAAGQSVTAGDATSLADAIRAFQSANSLDSDGIIGPSTWARLCSYKSP